MALKLKIAEPDEAEEIAALRCAAADDLTARFGKGHWSTQTTARGVLFDMRQNKVFAAKRRGRIVATLVLGTRKPWAIDVSYFTPFKAKALYLTAMAVAPKHQRAGIGRACLDEAERLARAWPTPAIRLDAYDADAGAGEFYAKCGYREVGRASYRTTPLIYFERLL